MVKHWTASMRDTFRLQGEIESLRYAISEDEAALKQMEVEVMCEYSWFDAKAFQSVGGSA